MKMYLLELDKTMVLAPLGEDDSVVLEDSASPAESTPQGLRPSPYARVRSCEDVALFGGDAVLLVCASW
jgi:hypothetical protein